MYWELSGNNFDTFTCKMKYLPIRVSLFYPRLVKLLVNINDFNLLSLKWNFLRKLYFLKAKVFSVSICPSEHRHVRNRYLKGIIPTNKFKSKTWHSSTRKNYNICSIYFLSVDNSLKCKFLVKTDTKQEWYS